MLRKISNKITFSYTVLIIFLVLFLLIFFNDLVRETHLNILKKGMSEKIGFIELSLKGILQGQGLAPGNRTLMVKIRKLSEVINLRITIVNDAGNVLADSEVGTVETMDNHRTRNEISNAFGTGAGDSIRYSRTLRIDMLYYAMKSGAVVIRLAKPLYEVEENLSRVRKLILFLGGVIIIVTLIIVAIISKKITGPINETLDFAEKFSEGDYSRRILNYSDDEIGNLQMSLNKLADIIVDKIDNLVLEQKKLEITIESIHDGIAVIDHNKNILIANRSFMSFLDVRTEYINRKYFEVIRSSSFNSKVEFALMSGESSEFEEEFLNRKYCEVFITPVKEEKTIQGILIVVHDITEKKRIDRLKTELVGNLSHELKTPVAIQKGYLETIREYLDDRAMCMDFLDKSLVNVERQNSIINDMLKLNKIETSRSFSDEEIDIKETILNCVELLNHKALKKGVAIQAGIDALNRKIHANRFLAEEVFFNIIDNAINYNVEKGSITISALTEQREVIIRIADTGIGIPEDSIDKIFERFYRVDQSRSRSTGGTGLGLSIVKHAAEMLKWNVEVNSGSTGTEFTIHVPFVIEDTKEG
ncbi:MAG TPA: ATP-binding protein [Spirochaetota bacterium]|nr:ATP-binding protein [Spirochaetota bacterium]